MPSLFINISARLITDASADAFSEPCFVPKKSAYIRALVPIRRLIFSFNLIVFRDKELGESVDGYLSLRGVTHIL